MSACRFCGKPVDLFPYKGHTPQVCATCFLVNLSELWNEMRMTPRISGYGHGKHIGPRGHARRARRYAR
jgi:hypothetical protein